MNQYQFLSEFLKDKEDKELAKHHLKRAGAIGTAGAIFGGLRDHFHWRNE